MLLVFIISSFFFLEEEGKEKLQTRIDRLCGAGFFSVVNLSTYSIGDNVLDTVLGQQGLDIFPVKLNTSSLHRYDQHIHRTKLLSVVDQSHFQAVELKVSII